MTRYFHSRGLRQRGDTLIEVLLAVSLLSAVIIIIVAMMNRGTAIALDAVERSQVTAYMTEQSEALQYIRDSYANAEPDDQDEYPAALWTDLLNLADVPVNANPCAVNTNPFYIERTISGLDNTVTVDVANFNPNTINAASPDFVETFAQPGSGLWVEAERPTTNPTGLTYVDFHIKACWQGINSGPKSQAKTIVRLYHPEIVVGADEPEPCEASPHDIIMVLDASASMIGNNLGPVTRLEALESVSASFISNTSISPQGNHMSVASFNDDGTLDQGLTTNTGVLTSAIYSLDVEPLTMYLSGLNVATDEFSSIRARTGVQKVVIFVSDGRPDDSTSLITTKTNDMKSSGIAIYTVGIDVNSEGAAILAGMAGAGGTYANANNRPQLESIMQAISDSLDCE